MDNESIKFETSKNRVLCSFLMPILLAPIFVVLPGAVVCWLIRRQLTSERMAYMEQFQHMLADSMGWALFAIVVIYVIVLVFSLNRTAYKVLIGEHSLDISTFWQEHNLRWTDVAQVKRLVDRCIPYLYVETWDAQTIMLSPPLKPLETLEKEIRARALDAVDAPPRPGQRAVEERKRELFFAELQQGARQLLIVVAIAAGLVGGFQLWQQIRDPEITILGGTESPLAFGKKMWVDEYFIYNGGREVRGIEIEVSGDAFEKQWLKNPVVLIETQDRSTLSFPNPIKNQTRELLTLLPKDKGIWAATSNSTVLKHKDFLVLAALSGVMNGLRGDNNWEHEHNITLFADVLKKGKGKVTFKVAPIGFPATQTSTQAATTIENHGRATLIASVGVPSDFPVSAYPGSQIALLSAWDIKLYSAASDKDIIAFYKEELKRKGWHTVETYGGSKTTLHAKKHKDKLSIEIDSLKEGTQIELELNFR